MKNRSLYLLLTLFMLISTFNLVRSEITQESADRPEIFIEKNEETGVFDKSFNLNDDQNQLTLLAGANANIKNFASIMSGEFHYATNLKYFWGVAFISYLRGDFLSVAENREGTTANLYAESNNPRPDGAKVKLSSYGPGVMFRHLFPETLNLLNIDNLFHSTSFYVTYNSLDDYHRSINYKGPGIKLLYGLSKRFSQAFETRINFSYQIAEVDRSESMPNESSHDKSLLLSYLTFSLGLSFYL